MAKAMCPNCGRVSPLPDALLGRKVRCKVCGKEFVAAALQAAASSVATGDGGVLRTVARRVGASANRSGVFGASTTTALGVQAPPNPGGRPFWFVVAAAALVLPIAAAGGLVAYKWMGARGHGAATAAETTADASGNAPCTRYGGIEVGSSGVKATVVELFPDKDLNYNYTFVWKASIDTKVTTGMDKTGRFDPDALRDSVDAVQQFYEKLTKEYELPKERIFIAGSSGLFGAVRKLKDKTDKDKADLIQQDQTALTDPVEKATGKKIVFIDVAEEVKLLISGLVPKKYDDSSVLIDVGTGGVRGGCHDLSGLFVPFEAPGVGAFEAKIKARAGKPDDLPGAADQLAEAELRAPLRKALERKTGLINRPRVYLNGGTVWVMATVLEPKQRGANVKLKATDIDAFYDLVTRDPRKKFPTVSLPADLDPDVQKEVQADIDDMKNRFETSKLIAGAEVLKALSAELQFQDKELYYTRYGDVGWLLSYIGEAYTRENGTAGK